LLLQLSLSSYSVHCTLPDPLWSNGRQFHITHRREKTSRRYFALDSLLLSSTYSHSPVMVPLKWKFIVVFRDLKVFSSLIWLQFLHEKRQTREMKKFLWHIFLYFFYFNGSSLFAPREVVFPSFEFWCLLNLIIMWLGWQKQEWGFSFICLHKSFSENVNKKYFHQIKVRISADLI
jgi:hypothetical protein